jgi:hypothetical protein
MVADRDREKVVGAKYIPNALDEPRISSGFEIDGSALQMFGWTASAIDVRTESDLQDRLLALGALVGTPVTTNSRGVLCDKLSPTGAGVAKPRSLTKVYGPGGRI